MDELNSIIRELNSIIGELEEIESDLRSKFKGIYTENNCANAVSAKLRHYYTARSKLQNIDTSVVNE